MVRSRHEAYNLTQHAIQVHSFRSERCSADFIIDVGAAPFSSLASCSSYLALLQSFPRMHQRDFGQDAARMRPKVIRCKWILAKRVMGADFCVAVNYRYS